MEWKDVDFYRKAMEDPTVHGTISIVTDPYIQFATGDRAERRGVSTRSSIKRRPAWCCATRRAQIGGRVYLNDDNSVYTGAAIFDGISPAGVGSTAGLYRYNGPLRQGDFQFRKIDAEGELEEFIPGHKANVPLERYSVFARARVRA